MNTTTILEQQLTELGYTPLWIEYGVLTAETLAFQYEHHKTSADDESPEHYRYASFRNFLHNKTILTDAECEQYAHLARIDEASAMASAAMVDILRIPMLTEKQFVVLSEAFATFGTWTEKIIAKERGKFRVGGQP